MMVLVSSHVRFSRTGSCASAFQKLLILSVLRVAMMSSYTARTSGLALSYSMNPNVDIVLLDLGPQHSAVSIQPVKLCTRLLLSLCSNPPMSVIAAVVKQPLNRAAQHASRPRRLILG